MKLKPFRNEMTKNEAEIILKRIDEHERKGVFYRPQINWAGTFSLAIELSRKHTGSIGARSLDVLHVALALSLRMDDFLTFDERQFRMAAAAGLRVKHCNGA
jgi:predicted nucleic acid-binding protein